MKTCRLCKCEKDLKFFTTAKDNKDGLSNWCNKCKAEKWRSYNEKYKQREGYNDKVREGVRKWVNGKGREKMRKHVLDLRAKQSKEYHDTHVKRLLKLQGFPADLITPELINLERQILKIKRYVRNKDNS